MRRATRPRRRSAPAPTRASAPECPPALPRVAAPHAAGPPVLETGRSRTKAYVDARRAVTFSFRASGAPPASLTVELLNAADGTVFMTWPPPVAPGQVQSVSWSGRIGSGSALPGRYAFRLTAAGADGAVAH